MLSNYRQLIAQTIHAQMAEHFWEHADTYEVEMTDSEVQAKADAAVKWCENASEYLLKNGGKAWKYLLIPHDEVKENYKLEDFVRNFKR